LARIRPGLAESRDADHDETRIALRELLIAATPLLHCAGTEVLEQKVRARSEIAQQLLAFRPPEIQGDRFLVARDHRPPERLAMRLLAAPLPHRVALPGRLDLYDLGAHVAEQLTAERSGEQRAGLRSEEHTSELQSRENLVCRL